jgi:hypothetical protein
MSKCCQEKETIIQEHNRQIKELKLQVDIENMHRIRLHHLMERMRKSGRSIFVPYDPDGQHPQYATWDMPIDGSFKLHLRFFYDEVYIEIPKKFCTEENIQRISDMATLMEFSFYNCTKARNKQKDGK